MSEYGPIMDTINKFENERSVVIDVFNKIIREKEILVEKLGQEKYLEIIDNYKEHISFLNKTINSLNYLFYGMWLVKIQLSRSPIWKKLPGLDITVKSGKTLGKSFAPTWSMVLNHKKGEMTDQEYTDLYLEILDKIDEQIYEKLYQYGTDNNGINFLCYCRDGIFCHTYLLIDYLIKKFPDKYERKNE